MPTPESPKNSPEVLKIGRTDGKDSPLMLRTKSSHSHFSKQSIVSGTESQWSAFSSGGFSKTDGLEPLTDLDSLFIESRREQFKFDVHRTLTRRYSVLNIRGDEVFKVGEEVDCGSKCWRGMNRRFIFYIFTTDGQLILSIQRQKIRVCSACPFPSSSEMGVDPDVSNQDILSILDTCVLHVGGFQLGKLRNLSSALMPQYEAEDDEGFNLINIRSKYFGTICHLFNCRNSKMDMYDHQRNYLGAIQKKVTLVDAKGKSRRCLGCNFPPHLSPVFKALILACMFEMKVTYFDRCLSFVDVLWTVVVLGLVALTFGYIAMIYVYIEKQHLHEAISPE